MKNKNCREIFIQDTLNAFKLFSSDININMNQVEDIIRLSVTGISNDGFNDPHLISPNRLTKELIEPAKELIQWID